MTIYAILSINNTNLFDFYFNKLYEDREEREQNIKIQYFDKIGKSIIEKRIELLKTYDYIIIDRECFVDNDISCLQTFKQVISFMDETKPIIVWKDINESNKKELINAGLQNLICNMSYNENKEEILECFSEKGMQRYNTEWKTKNNENIEKYFFKQDTQLNIGIFTLDNVLRCNSFSMSLAQYILNVDGKVILNCPFNTGTELGSIANIMKADEQTYTIDKKNIGYYEKNNLLIINNDSLEVDNINQKIENFNIIINNYNYININTFFNNEDEINKNDKIVIICDINELEIDALNTIREALDDKSPIIVNSFDAIDTNKVSGLNKEFYDTLSNSNKIKKFEKQKLVDARTNSHIYRSLISSQIIAKKVVETI